MIGTAEWIPNAGGLRPGGVLPRSPGAYLLLFEIAEPLTFRVGRLGEGTLAPARYAYIGSARGPGGLAARVGRHLNPARRPHWHVDALTARAPIVAIYTVESAAPLECAWVRWLLARPGSGVPMRGFGSSDCHAGCPAHLVRIPVGLNPGEWRVHERELSG